MRLSSTLSLYMSRQYLQSVALVFLLVMLTILIADTIELLRRASGPDKTATIETVLQMASLHIPFMAQKALPASSWWRVRRASRSGNSCCLRSSSRRCSAASS